MEECDRGYYFYRMLNYWLHGYMVTNPAIPSTSAATKAETKTGNCTVTPRMVTLFRRAGSRPPKFTVRATIFRIRTFSPRTNFGIFLQKQPVVHFATPESFGYMVTWLQISTIIRIISSIHTCSVPDRPLCVVEIIPIVCTLVTLPHRPPSKRRTP